MDITNLGYFKNTQLRRVPDTSASIPSRPVPTRPHKLIPRFNTGLEKKAQIMLSQHRPT